VSYVCSAVERWRRIEGVVVAGVRELFVAMFATSGSRQIREARLGIWRSVPVSQNMSRT